MTMRVTGIRITLAIVVIFAAGNFLVDNAGFRDATEAPDLGGYNPRNETLGVATAEAWIRGKDAATISTTLEAVHDSACGRNWGGDMAYLCITDFVRTAARRLVEGEEVNVIQIGAHVGFEPNDPIAGGLSAFLTALTSATNETELRRQFHWTFVEPSPANFKGLESNLKKYTNICDMRSMNAAVVSDLANNTGKMVFYGMSEAIDPVTGFDSRSNQRLPDWLTQISSLSRDQVFQPLFVNAFRKFGLDINDYVVEKNVTTLSYTELMGRALVQTPGGGHTGAPLLVLVDTEGFDCNVVEGMGPQSLFLPQYLIFEHIHCNSGPTTKHLNGIGYVTKKTSENIVAVNAIM